MALAQANHVKENATVNRMIGCCMYNHYRVAPYPMSHTVENKSKLIARVRRLKGQMEAIERALEAETSCAEILNLAASVRGATNGLVVELLEDHLRNHILHVENDAQRASGTAELIEVMRRHLK